MSNFERSMMKPEEWLWLRASLLVFESICYCSPFWLKALSTFPPASAWLWSRSSKRTYYSTNLLNCLSSPATKILIGGIFSLSSIYAWIKGSRSDYLPDCYLPLSYALLSFPKSMLRALSLAELLPLLPLANNGSSI